MTASKYIDSTLLKAIAGKDDIIKLCEEAIECGFYSVCVNPVFVPLAKDILAKSDVKVCTVVGFPLGANTIDTKVYEAVGAIINGADEIDMVINVSKVKEKDWDYLQKEISALREATKNRVLKVIIETCYLSELEIEEITKLVMKCQADFIKTSTGFGNGGAKESDIILMKKIVGDNMKIKASGGIKTKEDFNKMINAGASRIGTSNGKELI